MKNKLIYIFLGLFLFNSQFAFALDKKTRDIWNKKTADKLRDDVKTGKAKHIKDILNDVRRGKTIEEEMEYTAFYVSSSSGGGNLIFFRKVSSNLALYIFYPSPPVDDIFNPINTYAILVKVDPKKFFAGGQELLEAPYKLIGSMDLTIGENQNQLIPFLIFEAILPK